jgi:nucleotide-binding universal stress UspA family protein
MIKSILVPLDGFPYAEHALMHGIALAKRWGSSLRILHVLDTSAPPPYASAMNSREWKQGAAHAADVYTKTQAARGTSAGVRTAYSVVGGPIAEAITSYAEHSRSDFIVMATHGRGPVSRVMMGGVANEVVNRATVPVMLIRIAEDHAIAPMPRFRKVMIPLDGSPVAETGLDVALEIARRESAHLVLFHVAFPTDVVLPVMQADLVTSLAPVTVMPLARDPVPEQYLGMIAASAGYGRVVIETEISVSVAPAEVEIARYAEDHDVDLITLGTRGHGFLRGLLGLSVTESLVRHASIPILVVRSG